MSRTLLPITLFAALSLVGCNGKSAATPPSSATQQTVGDGTGLKKLGIEDTKKGAPTRYQKNIKPTVAGDKVWMYYTGTLKDGREFDGNNPKNHPEKWPISFVLGQGTMIRGWDEGLVGMMPGGKRKLSVPWSLAYGETGSPVIPPKTDLYFDVELLDVVKSGETSVIDFYDEKVGTGPAVTKGRIVQVHFTISTTGGHEVENTRTKKKPETFTIGKDEVHLGFEAGLEGMKKGGVRFFRLPPMVGFRIEGDPESAPPELVTYVKAEVLSVQ